MSGDRRSGLTQAVASPLTRANPAQRDRVSDARASLRSEARKQGPLVETGGPLRIDESSIRSRSISESRNLNFESNLLNSLHAKVLFKRRCSAAVHRVLIPAGSTRTCSASSGANTASNATICLTFWQTLICGRQASTAGLDQIRRRWLTKAAPAETSGYVRQKPT